MSRENEVKAIESVCSGVSIMNEAGIMYIYLPNLKVSAGDRTLIIDALLCPQQHGGYTTRLFLSESIPNVGANWTAHLILCRNWYTWSWNNVPAKLELIQILSAHLKALK